MSVAPAPFELLDAYQSGEMPDAEAAQFEEALFASAAAGTAEEAHLLDRLSVIGRFLASRGGWGVANSRARIDELQTAGLRVQMFEPRPGAAGEALQIPKIDDGAEIVVTHLNIDVRGYDAVDLIVEKPDGTELKVFRDLDFDPADGNVYLVCEAPLARIAATQRHVSARVVGTRAGVQHLVAVFEVVHAP